MGNMRVAYTVEQCWHRVPGGTAVAALRTAEAIVAGHPDVELIGVAGRHRRSPQAPWRPTIPVSALPIAAPWLYEAWLRAGWPKVEGATGEVDVAHATTVIPCASDAPLVVTVHDLAFVHEPAHFTRHGVRVFRRSLERIAQQRALVLCSSTATIDDCVAAGLAPDRLRLVPLGVGGAAATHVDVRRVRDRHGLPGEYVLFVGTVEPRKNLAALARAVASMDRPLPLVVAGAEGWGDRPVELDHVRFLGFVPGDDLPGLYAGATVFAYPSLREGYGLPVLEAMAQGAPVVTSMGTATEETAGGAAVLVDPASIESIADGLREALERRDELSSAGRAHAANQSWQRTAALTVAAYREAVAAA